MALTDILNSGNLNDLGEAFGRMSIGTLLAYVCNKATATEAGLTPATNVVTLAAAPTAVFQVNATAETGTTAIKKLRKGPISGANAFVPAPGECVWDGGLHILFNAADIVTAASVTYSIATDTSSLTAAKLSDL